VGIVSTFLIAVVLIIGMVGCVPASQNLEIRNWYDLDAVRDEPYGHYILMNNLDSTTAGYEKLAGPIANQGKGWEPIWDFTGIFEGQGYEIRNLFISRLEENYIGLFGFVYEGAVIKNLGVVDVSLTGRAYTGGVVGHNGYVGLGVPSEGGTVTNCYATGDVIGHNNVGGLAGFNVGTVTNCYATCNVTGLVSVGGLVGNNWDTVSNCYATCSVTGEDVVGGLIGSTYQSTVSNSCSSGNVTGEKGIGGLVGFNNQGTVYDSYSTGIVTGNFSIGGLVGDHHEGTVTNSFWDTETSEQATSAGGTGKTTAEMQDIATFSGAGWNIIAVGLNETHLGYIWNIVNNVTYPFLSWQS